MVPDRQIFALRLVSKRNLNFVFLAAASAAFCPALTRRIGLIQT
jgi:hypothetical protein